MALASWTVVAGTFLPVIGVAATILLAVAAWFRHRGRRGAELAAGTTTANG